MARVLSIVGRPEEALELYQRALHLSGSSDAGTPPVFWLSPDDEAQVKTRMARLKRQLSEGPASGLAEPDGGDGSGRWKVASIAGVSWDTCVYRLERARPAEPHPFPRHAWHVSARLGGDAREYTPVSSAADWERGVLELLVKTYAQGRVSKRFGMAETFEQALRESQLSYSPLEERRCWVHVSRPK